MSQSQSQPPVRYHFLRQDMTTGDEPAWTVGEQRSIKGKLALCRRGYHSSPTPWDALRYAPGPILCEVEVSRPVESDDTKSVSRTRRLLSARDVSTELRLFAADCAERALDRERAAGREPATRSWLAVKAARAFARGEISSDDLEAAYSAAYSAANSAAHAANSAAYSAASAANNAADRATLHDERVWQRARLDQLLEGTGDRGTGFCCLVWYGQK